MAIDLRDFEAPVNTYIEEPKISFFYEPQIIRGDARRLPLPDSSVDLVVTSPPYWKKRDYGVAGQIGQEDKPDEYIHQMLSALTEWARVLRPTGSVFINIGDSYHNRSLVNIPGRLEIAAADKGWRIRNRIIWVKETGMPEPARNRLANRHEYIIHLTRGQDYYYDAYGFSDKYGNGSTPGDVWRIGLERNMGNHLAPFPEEIVARAVELACPREVCIECSQPRKRIVVRTAELDPSRPQARRAMELARLSDLSPEHIAAVQATGISDAGKALRVQTGTGRNSARVRLLAAEAKAALGGYFREFTFARKRTVGWSDCSCGAPYTAGTVLDPFMGTGTTLRVARRLSRASIGVDLCPEAYGTEELTLSSVHGGSNEASASGGRLSMPGASAVT